MKYNHPRNFPFFVESDILDFMNIHCLYWTCDKFFSPKVMNITSKKLKQGDTSKRYLGIDLMSNQYIIHNQKETWIAGDCHDNYGHKGWCASGAIKTFTSQLTKFQNPSALAIPPRRTKALETTCKHWFLPADWSSVELQLISYRVFLWSKPFQIKDSHVAWFGFADNLTEALLFLAHIIGDIHQVLLLSNLFLPYYIAAVLISIIYHCDQCLPP